ncbi:hypothetical protein [Burkholderia ubonensis]|uniref:hypothetical protein n=1 Tax=Burkholderia ubonensis TaxID=101571 RepID=UPI000758F6AB|nr:hypothetical protein [Burkholderia ubonensis]KVW35341.1 hypothetical protein WK93_29530 [Burkholderia ubonensis]
MAETNYTPVGRNPQSKYVAFGDDCHFNDICGYAYVVIQRSRILWALREINKIKDEFRIPHATSLHCRVLFGFNQRQKAGLDHLDEAHARSIVLKCLLLLNNIGAHVRFASASLSAYETAMGDSIAMRNQSGEEEIVLPVHTSPKALLSLLAQMCLMVPAPERKFANAHEWELVISQDATKIKSIGDGKRQVHNLMSGGFSSVGAPEGQFHQFMPHVSTEADHPLLQLADVAVYSLSHVLDASDRSGFWRTQLPTIRLLHRIPYTPIKPGG